MQLNLAKIVYVAELKSILKYEIIFNEIYCNQIKWSHFNIGLSTVTVFEVCM